MKDFVQAIEDISNKDDFLRFTIDLAMDAKENIEEWASDNISDYIEQMASWVEDSGESAHGIDWENVDYKTIAKFLYMGKIYE